MAYALGVDLQVNYFWWRYTIIGSSLPTCLFYYGTEIKYGLNNGTQHKGCECGIANLSWLSTETQQLFSVLGHKLRNLTQAQYFITPEYVQTLSSSIYSMTVACFSD